MRKSVVLVAALSSALIVVPVATSAASAAADSSGSSGFDNPSNAGNLFPDPHGGWNTAWSAAPQPAWDWDDSGWSEAGFDNQSIRQVARVSTGGSTLRVRLSNAYGESPLRLTGATVAKAADDGAVRPETLRPLMFDHRASTVVPVGDEVASDPVPLRTKALDRLAVTLYFDDPTGPTTQHQLATATTYRAAGDHRLDVDGSAFDATTTSWFFFSGVDVSAQDDDIDDGEGHGNEKTVVTFGDSITDGAGSTVDANNRYPDELAERLVRSDRDLAVANAGISGNRVLNDSPCFGEKGVARFERDVLEPAGVRTAIVLEGINDIGFSEIEDDQFSECFQPDDPVTAADLIDGHQALIDAAHARGVKIIGATLLPYKGADYYSKHGEAVRDRVNDWIRTSGEYDAVVDLDRALADPNDPNALKPEYDSGDALHPSDAGMRAMAEAIDLDEL